MTPRTLRLRRFAGFTPHNAADRIRDTLRFCVRTPEPRQWRTAGWRDYGAPYQIFLALRCTEHFCWPRRNRSLGARAAYKGKG